MASKVSERFSLILSTRRLFLKAKAKLCQLYDPSVVGMCLLYSSLSFPNTYIRASPHQWPLISTISRRLSLSLSLARTHTQKMEAFSSPKVSSLLLFSLFVSSLMATASAGNFYQDFDLTWGDRRAKIVDGGKLLMLSLDRASGSGFRSKKEYLFGRIDMQLKLVSGNSAGTVTAYYVRRPSTTFHISSLILY